MGSIMATSKDVQVYVFGNWFLSSLSTLQTYVMENPEPIRVHIYANPYMESPVLLMGSDGAYIYLPYEDFESFTITDAVRVLNDSLTGK